MSKSPYLITFSENNTLGTIGSYRIVSYAAPFQNITSITNLLDTVTGETSNYGVQTSIRWSIDGAHWSLWIDYTANGSPGNMGGVTDLRFTSTNPLWMEFKFLVVSIGSPALAPGTAISPEITIDSLDLTTTVILPDKFAGFPGPARGLCSNEYLTNPVVFQDKKYTFNPYAVNSGTNLYKDLSLMVNNVFGWDTVYFRRNPSRRSKDVIFREWTIFKVETQTCLKLLVNNNAFPDSKPNYTPMDGMNFEMPFELHVDRTYWESFFGKNTMPQQRDIIYLPVTNRLYEIQSSYIYRDFMNVPLYFKMLLTKYEPSADTIMEDSIRDTLEDLTLSNEKLFGEEVEDQFERHTKPQQFVTITAETDPIRSMVNSSLTMGNHAIYNNWTLVANHYYDMDKLYREHGLVSAVVYRAPSKLDADDSRSFTCWFMPKTNSTTMDNTRNLLYGLNGVGQGMSIDLVMGTPGQVNLNLNGTVHTFTLNTTLALNTWYALVVNFSNFFSQASVDLWIRNEGTSQLTHLCSVQQTITPAVFDAAVSLGVMSSSLHLTNLRLFDEMMTQESQNLVLNQLLVVDSQKAFVIDNAMPLLRLAKVANPK